MISCCRALTWMIHDSGMYSSGFHSVPCCFWSSQHSAASKRTSTPIPINSAARCVTRSWVRNTPHTNFHRMHVSDVSSVISDRVPVGLCGQSSPVRIKSMQHYLINFPNQYRHRLRTCVLLKRHASSVIGPSIFIARKCWRILTFCPTKKTRGGCWTSSSRLAAEISRQARHPESIGIWTLQMSWHTLQRIHSVKTFLGYGQKTRMGKLSSIKVQKILWQTSRFVLWKPAGWIVSIVITGLHIFIIRRHGPSITLCHWAGSIQAFPMWKVFLSKRSRLPIQRNKSALTVLNWRSKNTIRRIIRNSRRRNKIPSRKLWRKFKRYTAVITFPRCM